MGKLDKRVKPRFVGQDPNNPNGFPALVGLHMADLYSLGYAKTSMPQRFSYLEHLSAWCAERGLWEPRDLTKPVLEQYRRQLSRTPHQNNPSAMLSFTSQVSRLTAIREFFRWLSRHNYILSNPASDLERPRVPQRLPRYVLSQDEIEAILRQPDVETIRGLRDRALLELFYATGIRRREATRLDLHDLHFGRGMVFIREGKNGKDRYVPMSERLHLWLLAYLERSRPHLSVGCEEHALWLGQRGERLEIQGVGNMVKEYKDKAGIDVPGSVHLFRHAMATLMMEGGADIRYVQQILGHANVATTEIYTHVSLNQLKAVYEATHPGAKLQRRQDAGDLEPGEGSG